MTEIRPMRDADIAFWMKLRSELWPECGPKDNEEDVAAYRAGGPVKIVFLAFDGAESIGFAEISERSVADGCGHDPVAYLEGCYVPPAIRGRVLAGP